MNAPSLWYVVGILGALATSWWISELYQRHCPFAGTEGRKWHGAGIFSLALFAQWSLLLAFAGRGRPDNWVMWAIGIALATWVIRRFWLDKDRGEDAK